MLGTYALSAGYYDAYYGQAQRVRTLIIRDFERAYEQFDVLALADVADGRVRARREDRRPAHDVPQRHLHDPVEPGRPRRDVGAVRHRAAVGRADGTPALPIGVQVLAPARGEPVMFRVARAIELAAPGGPRS